MPIFDDHSARRISRAVLKSEQQQDSRVARRRRQQRGEDRMATLGFADEDIAHDANGKIWFAQGSPGSESTTTAYVTAYNTTGITVWAGSKVELEYLAVTGSSGSAWHIVKAYSAKRIKGTAAAYIAVGSSGTINSVSGIDGHYSPTTATVYLLPGYYAPSGQGIIGHWHEADGKWYAIACCAGPTTTTGTPTTPITTTTTTTTTTTAGPTTTTTTGEPTTTTTTTTAAPTTTTEAPTTTTTTTTAAPTTTTEAPTTTTTTTTAAPTTTTEAPTTTTTTTTTTAAPCGACQSGTTPSIISVTIGLDDTVDCTLCDEYDGTYDATQNAACQWHYAYPESHGNGAGGDLTVTMGSNGNITGCDDSGDDCSGYFIMVTYHKGSGGSGNCDDAGDITWIKCFASAIDCSNLSDTLTLCSVLNAPCDCDPGPCSVSS